MKKIVFVTHEFGLYPGHGGIASYLYQLCSLILKLHKGRFKVYVVSSMYDKKCDLLNNDDFFIYSIKEGTLHEQGLSVLKILKSIKPDYVEVAEFLGLALESLIYRNEVGEELNHTVFITNHHTASKECFEWSSKLPISLAPYHIQEAYQREKIQMLLSDMNESPSNFLANYVVKNYKLSSVRTVRHPVNFEIKSKNDLICEISNKIDIESYKEKFVISCITRIEGRKNQLGLVKAFIEFCKESNANAVLLLVGNSSINNITGQDEKLELYKEIPNEYYDKIQIFDFMGNEGKKMILSISDVAVLASPFENFPVAMTEYVYQGVPVIASKYSGCYDFMSGCEQLTSFNPFLEGDLKRIIKNFYELSKEEQNELINTQLLNLKEIVSTKNSVDLKLEMYSKLKIKSQQCSIKNNTIYINSKNIFDIISEKSVEQCVDIVVSDSDECKIVLEKFIHKNWMKDIYKQSIICIGDDVIDYNVSTSLIKHKIIILNNVKIKTEDIGKKISELISEKIIDRDKSFYYFPIYNILRKKNKPNLYEKKSKKLIPETEVDLYNIILNEIFYRKNSIKLEEYI
ncbi:glycosyltransferase family 4 protein [Clostridium botulinum]|nr:glycosyltransferase family 4 protein [Clostridium botulinum]